jgi:hypothetical protein
VLYFFFDLETCSVLHMPTPASRKLKEHTLVFSSPPPPLARSRRKIHLLPAIWYPHPSLRSPPPTSTTNTDRPRSPSLSSRRHLGFAAPPPPFLGAQVLSSRRPVLRFHLHRWPRGTWGTPRWRSTGIDLCSLFCDSRFAAAVNGRYKDYSFVPIPLVADPFLGI